MVRWHHRLNGHEFEQISGDCEGQRSLACCSPWGHKRVRLNLVTEKTTTYRHRCVSTCVHIPKHGMYTHSTYVYAHMDAHTYCVTHLHINTFTHILERPLMCLVHGRYLKNDSHYSFRYAEKDSSWERLKAGGEAEAKDEMVRWHHQLDRHEFEQAPGVADGQGSLACCSPWGHKESETTKRLN